MDHDDYNQTGQSSSIISAHMEIKENFYKLFSTKINGWCGGLTNEHLFENSNASIHF